jgi:beta-phosphoglucomutase
MGAAIQDSAVIWDVDGTMVDTSELHFQAWSAVARELGQPFTRADFAATFGRRNPEIVRQLFPGRFSERDLEALAERKEQLYRDAAGKGVTLLPGTGPLLEALAAAGFHQAIGSSAPRANLELILEVTGTARFFDVIVAMEDTQRGKPDPQVFQVAAERLGVRPGRCVVIEDAVAGVQAAKAAGMKCLAVSVGGHHSIEALRQAGADWAVRTLAEVAVGTVRELFGSGGQPC